MMTRTTAVVAAMLVTALAAPRADILEQVLVKVNGDIITKTELEQRQIAALRQKNPNLRANDEAALRQALAEVTPEVIEVAAVACQPGRIQARRQLATLVAEPGADADGGHCSRHGQPLSP